MKIEIESKSGFCFGVENAVAIAEKALAAGETIFSLGHIVHNEKEVKRLESLGLKTITMEEFSSLHDCKVLIRAHGEPPSTYQIAERNNIEIIEATCPIVKLLQKRINIAHRNSSARNEQVVIFGKPGHAEVAGLIGQTNGEAILVSGLSDLDRIDFSRPLIIFSQTTMSREAYISLNNEIKENYRRNGRNPLEYVKINNTICGQVANREPSLRKFSSDHEVIIFVSGKESSNGRMLYSICKDVNDETYFVSGPDDLKAEWFKEKDNIGLCGATSTPKWLINEVEEKIISLSGHEPD